MGKKPFFDLRGVCCKNKQVAVSEMFYKNANFVKSQSHEINLTLPPRERPHWKAAHGGELRVLGWGSRRYGEQPMPVTAYDGWPLVVILKGSPTLVLKDRQHRLAVGSLLAVHPDCPVGWTDNPGKDCEILSWVWINEPSADLGLPRGVCRISAADEAGLRRLESLHEMCRREVADGDHRSFSNLRALRVLVENEFARHASERTGHSESRMRMRLAADYLRSHLGRRDAISLLRDYLGVSSADLQKLFLEHHQITPSGYLHRLRMETARSLLQDHSTSAKETAFLLGYAHPNDLSRAFARHFGMTIRAFQFKTKEKVSNEHGGVRARNRR